MIFDIPLSLSRSLPVSLSLSLHCSVTSPPEFRAVPLHDPEMSSHYWLSPDFPFMSFSRFPMMSWSCPFHAVQPPLHVPDIFSVCPLHFPCMSRSFVASHFPTSPVSLSFPLHSPVFISVPCMSLSDPLCFPFMSRRFPVMSTSYFLPSFPCTSLHFPFAPQYFPQNKRSPGTQKQTSLTPHGMWVPLFSGSRVRRQTKI